jgi:crotonobetainyl-CoA:carnitine CoA-transferase CaiB-like acyl-CoA transferase
MENEEHQKNIKLDDNLMMEMKYPSLDQFIKSNFDFNEENQVEQSFELIGACIDKVYSEEEVWATADCSKKEVNEFLEQMNSLQFKEVEKFFETMPKLSHTLNITNPKTKKKSEVVLEGLSSFFG